MVYNSSFKLVPSQSGYTIEYSRLRRTQNSNDI